MNDIHEVMKGATDLPIALIALLIGLLLRKKRSKDWGLLFQLVAVSGLLGAAVHMFALPMLGLQLTWMLLYILLFESIRRFSLLMAGYLSKTQIREKTAVYWTEGILFLAAAVTLFLHQGKDIYFLVVFMVIMVTRIIISLFRTGFASKKANALIVIVLVPVVLQAVAELLSAAVVMEHLCIIAGEVIAGRIGTECAEQESPA